MFGNGNYNNNSANQSVNTKIKTFFGDLSSLQLTYWNDNISIKINPLTGVNAEGIKQYDFTKRVSTSLIPEKCLALANRIDEKIKPEIKKVKQNGVLAEAVSVSVQIPTKKSIVVVEYKNDESTKPALYLTIYTNVSDDNKASENDTYSYKFSKVITIDNYDPTSGTGNQVFEEAEFDFFYEKIRKIADAIGTAAHSVNCDNASGKSGSKSSSNSNFTNFSNGNNTQAQMNNYSAPVSQFNADEFPFN